MDDKTIKGKVDDVKGRVKRQVGEWTGDENAQAEGTMDQAKGKVEKAFGEAKDKARDIADDLKRDERDPADRDAA
jgi:uncharacterized protein YjbJ (UPF0337 family)